MRGVGFLNWRNIHTNFRENRYTGIKVEMGSTVTVTRTRTQARTVYDSQNPPFVFVRHVLDGRRKCDGFKINVICFSEMVTRQPGKVGSGSYIT
jgi:hypothetical protein